MKVVILAGGLGTRLAEETDIRPKPMVQIGERPMLWHIMKIYSAYGFNEFIVCLGYKGYMIKEYFFNYRLHMADVTIDIHNGSIETHQNYAEPWKITLVETGSATMTGGRLKRIRPYLDDDEDFCLTYGDGVADVNISDLVEFHKKQGRLATVTAVQPAGRFGTLDLDNSKVTQFVEKPRGDGGWINAGFFVLNPAVLDYVEGDGTVWEQDPIRRLANAGQLSAYQHTGFWQAMDTLREKQMLETMWNENAAPWKVWS